jgi:hypothetical protein
MTDQDSNTQHERPGTLVRYLDVLHECQSFMVEKFTELFREMFSSMDDFMLGLAENAETNAVRNHCFEVMHEFLLRQTDVQRSFTNEINRGFVNFSQGKVEPLRSVVRATNVDQLSLIEKDDYEISLAYANILHRANNEFSAHLFALNHRLAVVNGGVKLGEYNPALPGSPAQVCDALQTALETIDIPISHKIRVALLSEFDQRVLRQAGPLYDAFNDRLIKAGVLPNLSLEAIGYKPGGRSAEGQAAQDVRAEEPAQPREATRAEENESSLDREIFHSIQEILARRHLHPAQFGGTMATAAQTNLPDLLASLNTLQVNVPPISRQQMAHLPLDAVKAAFAEQVARLGELVKEQQINSADADIIDLVGMLFEFILNDNTLPDSVKALLSHLHTPILKVALLDKKFFFRSKHPARRLLNTMTQAGALCNADETDEQGIFAKMQSIVDEIVHNFEDNTEIFTLLLEDFSEFLEGYSRKSKVVEKRVVETAKGRERLREARQAVSQEIVDRTWNRSLPKAVEELLLGPWANLMVLTNLRSGPDSEEWKQALALVDDVLWSVEPKRSEAERQQLKERQHKIDEAIRKGLAVIGDPEVNTNALLADLAACQRAAMEMTDESVAPAVPKERKKAPPAPPKPIWEDVEVETPEAREHPFLRDADPVLLAIVDELKALKLGASFEFTDQEKNQKLRAKLSWYSPKTSYYIFVNQAGIQVAVKSLRTLAMEIRRGETRIVPQARKPLMDRALETIYTLLHSPDESELGAQDARLSMRP